MPRYIVVLSMLLIALLIAVGCDDRGTNITRTDWGDLDQTAGIDPNRNHVFQPQLTLQIKNGTELLLGTAYLPAEAFPPTKPVPVLVLLAPEYGDKQYYFRAGLEQLMKEMTASGEIEPMVVYCIGNDPTFGGFWYGQSGPGGKYDDILGDSLIDFLNDFIPAIIDNPSKRGIGGIGQGAYGAFRAAIKHPGLYSSISVADGPLDFDGPSGNGGLMTLFDSAIAEQVAHYTGTDPFDFKANWDSSYTMPTSQMFVGGGFAFSPNDTAITFTREPQSDSLTIRLTITGKESIADSTLVGGGDSTTFIGNIINNTSPPTMDFDFHLPFDADGDVYTPIWDLWMQNNLEDIHDAQGGRPLDGVNMWVASNPGAKWNYYEMTQSWISFLQGNNYSVEEYEYGSFGDAPIQDDEYLYDLLRKMLKFHSDNFKD